MIHFSQNDDYGEQEARISGTHSMPCVICGKGILIEKAKYWLRLYEGATAINLEDVKTIPPAEWENGGDLGMHPIGADCLKRHPELKDYVNLPWKSSDT